MKKWLILINIGILIIILSACQRDPVSVKVTLMLDQNEVYEVIHISKNAKINLPFPEKTGHYFIGWFRDELLTDQVDLEYVVREDTTLYAVFEINYYLLEFETNGGFFIDAILVEYQHSLNDLKYGIKKAFHLKDEQTLSYAMMTLVDNLVSQVIIEDIATLYEIGHIHYDDAKDDVIVEVYTVNDIDTDKEIHISYYAKYIMVADTLFTAEVSGEQPSHDDQLPSQTIYYINDSGIEFSAWLELPQHSNLYRTHIKNDQVHYANDAKESINLSIYNTLYEEKYYLSSEFMTEAPLTAWEQVIKDITTYVKGTNMDYEVSHMVYVTDDIRSYWVMNQVEIDIPHASFHDYYVLLQQAYHHDGLNQSYKIGYQFMGWYLDETLTMPFNLEMMPGHDIILYAKWEN